MDRLHCGSRGFGSSLSRMKQPIVSCSPDIMGGTPVFAGTRVPVQTLLDYLEGGESIDDFLARISHGHPRPGHRLFGTGERQAHSIGVVRVLLDECIDWRLSREIVGHEVKTAQQMGWASLQNGELLSRAAGHFDVFVTVDRNLSFQQNLTSLPIPVVVLRAKTNR